MPQMAPTFWLFLLMMFFMMNMFYIINVYFNFKVKMKKNKMSNKYFKMNWKW